MAYLYSIARYLACRPGPPEEIMFVRAQQNWFRRVALAAAFLATAAFALGATPQPAAAQYYGGGPGYGYPYYPYYPYYNPYYAYGYPYWGWGWGWPWIGVGWGGWWGGRGCWNCGFRGGFGHAGFHGFHGGFGRGFHGGFGGGFHGGGHR